MFGKQLQRLGTHPEQLSIGRIIPPEQARGDAKRLDRRSDVYSLGATLYEVLTGKPPFADENVVNVLLKVMDEAPAPLRSHVPQLPEALELIVGKCLNKEPAQRYATAHALAEDLRRHLGAQRIVARRLSYRYRLAYWARRNKALAGVAAALLLSVLGSSGLAVRNRFNTLRKERLARQEAMLADRLGQSVKDLEWLIHASYQMPLHDASYEKDVVRERMAEISAELASAGDIGGRLGAYALGRGHLALHEWEPARQKLQQAAQLGYSHPELDYALGRVLGELFSQALADARRSGDRSFVERRRAELKAQYLVPALAHLQRSRGLRTVSASYLEGLLDYYQQRYDAALLNAHMARQKMPWLYEAAKLEGDVHLARALEQRDRGEPDQAERSFQQAIDRYGRAAELAPSDSQNHEALAEAWTRWQETDALRGRDPGRAFREALAAADRALEAAPTESYGHTRKAFAYYFFANYLRLRGEPDRAILLLQDQVAAATRGAATHPQDAYAFELLGLAYSGLATHHAEKSEPYQPLFERAYQSFDKAIQLNPRFPWALNDYALALNRAAFQRTAQNQDPGPLLARALQLAARAIELDPGYLYAYNTAITAYKNLSVWNLEHGLDTDAAAVSAGLIFDNALRLSSKLLPLHINFGLFASNHAELLINQGRDATKQIDIAVRAFESGIEINKSIPVLHRYLAYTHYLAAEGLRAAGQDPRPRVSSGLRALSGCYALDRDDLGCRGVEAQLRAVRAGWLQQGRAPYAGELERAYQLARQSAAQPQDEEALLLLAGVCLQKAQPPTARRDALALTGEGLAAVDRYLASAPGLPRALALKGALLRLRAAHETEPVPRRATLAAAAESFAGAFAGNPLLKRRHGGEAEEVQRQAATPAAP